MSFAIDSRIKPDQHSCNCLQCAVNALNSLYQYLIQKYNDNRTVFNYIERMNIASKAYNSKECVDLINEFAAIVPGLNDIHLVEAYQSSTIGEFMIKVHMCDI